MNVFVLNVSTKCIIIIKLIDFLVGNTKNVSCNVKCINALYSIALMSRCNVHLELWQSYQLNKLLLINHLWWNQRPSLTLS